MLYDSILYITKHCKRQQKLSKSFQDRRTLLRHKQAWTETFLISQHKMCRFWVWQKFLIFRTYLHRNQQRALLLRASKYYWKDNRLARQHNITCCSEKHRQKIPVIKGIEKSYDCKYVHLILTVQRTNMMNSPQRKHLNCRQVI